jgi:hypothetical protein
MSYKKLREALTRLGYEPRGGGNRPGITARSRAWNYRITRTETGWQVEPANSSKNYLKLVNALKELV